MKSLALTLLLGAFALSPVKADDRNSDKIDNIIAAGVVFKISYAFAQAPSDNPEDNKPEEIGRLFESIQRDLDGVSDSNHGKMLKAKGSSLIRLLRGLARNNGANDPEREKLLSEFGLAKSESDPAKVSARIGELISEYAKASETPDWVYDSRKRKQAAGDTSR